MKTSELATFISAGAFAGIMLAASMLGGCGSAMHATAPSLPPPVTVPSVTPSAKATVAASSKLTADIGPLITSATAHPDVLPAAQLVQADAQAVSVTAQATAADAVANDAQAKLLHDQYGAAVKQANDQAARADTEAAGRVKAEAALKAETAKYNGQWFAGKFWNAVHWLIGIAFVALIGIVVAMWATDGAFGKVISVPLGWLSDGLDWLVRTVASCIGYVLGHIGIGKAAVTTPTKGA